MEEVPVCGLAHPEIATLQVVRNFLGDRLRGRFADKSVGVGAPSHHGEVSSDHVISRLNVLIGSPVSRESRTVRGQVLEWASSLEQVFRLRPLVGIALLAVVELLVVGVHIEMGPVQPVVFASYLDVIGDGVLLIVAHLVDTSFAEIRGNILEFAQVPATVTGLADTQVRIMVSETSTKKLPTSLVKFLHLGGTPASLPMPGLTKQRFVLAGRSIEIEGVGLVVERLVHLAVLVSIFCWGLASGALGVVL